MGLLTKVIISVFLISFVVFVLFFGRLPGLRKTPIGALHRLLRIHIPGKLLALDQRLTNGRLFASTSRFVRHITNDRHPTVLILFILLMFVPECLFLPTVLPTLSARMQIASVLIVVFPYLFLYLASFADPGYVVKNTLDLHGSLYPYDHNLFKPGQFCKTCRLPKPPRSKHCSICRHCVGKMDHHCIFINGCVGYGNQHWFILLLLTTAVLTTTGAWLGGGYLLHIITSVFQPFTVLGSGLKWSEYFMFWSFGLQADPAVGSVALLCFLITPLVWGLFLYSLYLVYRGMTTNESGKWSDFQLDVADGYTARRPLPHDRRLDRREEPEVVDWPKSANHLYITIYEGQHDPRVDGSWEKGFKLADVENIYDIGFFGNLVDVFLPRRYLQAYTGAQWSRR